MVARNPCWAAAGAGGWPAVLLRTSLSAVTTLQPLQQSLVKHNELASDCCLVVVVLVLVAIKTWNNQLHPHHHQPSNCSLRGRVTILVSSNQLQLSLSASVTVPALCCWYCLRVRGSSSSSRVTIMCWSHAACSALLAQTCCCGLCCL